MNSETVGNVPWRTQLPVYGTALFSNSIPDLVLVVMQLWLIRLDTSLFLIGLVFGARYLGPLLLAIHGGALMDRLGTRRVMIFCSNHDRHPVHLSSCTICFCDHIFATY